MFKFIQNFINLINNVVVQTHCNSTTAAKKAVMSGVQLSFNTKTEKVKEKIENTLEQLLKKYKNSPEKLLKLVEQNGTKVYRIKNAKKILKIISQEEGFISNCTGVKAIAINLITKHEILTKFEPVFVIDTKNTDKYWLTQQVYKWYAQKMKLSGFEEKSQENFNKYMTGSLGSIENLSIDEIIGLKDAIARDVEAINFVVKMTKNTETAKSALEKIKINGATV